jgi:tetratricopeptide (TPR) repeat protein
MAKVAPLRRSADGPDIDPVELGRRLRAARLEKRMTLAQVGGQDLSRSFLSTVEHGRSRISLRALSIVADRLGHPMSSFLDVPDGSPASAQALAELMLDEVETALGRQCPGDALHLLDETSIPQPVRSRALWLRGQALTGLGRPREAIPILGEALGSVESEAEPRQYVLVEYALAKALFNAREYDEALLHLRSALERVVREVDDQVLMGKITVGIGHVHYVQGDFDAALAHYARARELFGTVDDLDNLAGVYTGLSRVYQHRGDIDNALRYSRLSVGIYEIKHNRRQAAHELNNMAARCRELGRLDTALEYAQQAIDWARESRATDVEALAHSTLAETYFQLDQLEAAESEAETAQVLVSDPHDLATIDAWIVLAKVAEQRGDQSRTDEMYCRALEALERIGHQTLYADTALAYSLALERRGDLRQALRLAREAAQAKATRQA